MLPPLHAARHHVLPEQRANGLVCELLAQCHHCTAGLLGPESVQRVGQGWVGPKQESGWMGWGGGDPSSKKVGGLGWAGLGWAGLGWVPSKKVGGVE